MNQQPKKILNKVHQDEVTSMGTREEHSQSIDLVRTKYINLNSINLLTQGLYSGPQHMANVTEGDLQSPMLTP